MATPMYGLAYGLGAGLSGVPQAYMQGVGNDMKLQASEMQLAQEQKRIQDMADMDMRLSTGIKQGLGYQGLMESMAQGGHGIQAAKYMDEVAKEKSAKENAIKQATIARIGMGDKAGAIQLMQQQGLGIKDYNIDQTGNFIELVTDKGAQRLRLDDALGMYQGGTLGQRMMQMGSKEAMFESGLKQKDEQFTRKQTEVERHNLEMEALRRVAARTGLTGDKATAFMKNVAFRARLDPRYAEDPNGVMQEYATKFAPGAVGEKSMYTENLRMLRDRAKTLESLYANDGGLNAATVAKKSKRDPQRGLQVQEHLDELIGIREAQDAMFAGGYGTKLAVGTGRTKPSSKVKWD